MFTAHRERARQAARCSTRAEISLFLHRKEPANVKRNFYASARPRVLPGLRRIWKEAPI